VAPPARRPTGLDSFKVVSAGRRRPARKSSSAHLRWRRRRVGRPALKVSRWSQAVAADRPVRVLQRMLARPPARRPTGLETFKVVTGGRRRPTRKSSSAHAGEATGSPADRAWNFQGGQRWSPPTHP